MKQRTERIVLVVSIIAVAALLGAALVVTNNGSQSIELAMPVQYVSAEEEGEAVPEGETDLNDEPEVVEEVGWDEEDANVVAQQINVIFRGYEPGELGVGLEADPSWEQERGIAAFSDDTLKTREQVCEFLHEDTPASQAARERVFWALAPYPGEAEKVGAGNCNNYMLFYPKVASQILGTSYLVDNEVLVSGTWRQVAENDAIWIYITDELVVVPDATVRADCANPGIRFVRPIRPGVTPPAPPIDVPPTPEELKCFDKHGNLIDPDGDGFCGTPDSGPEQQNPQADPVSPTPGYEPGNAEEVVEQQEHDAENVDTSTEPTEYGVPTESNPNGGGVSEVDTDHDGQPDQTIPDSAPGGSEGGTDDPEHHSGEEEPSDEEQPTNTGDPGSPF